MTENSSFIEQHFSKLITKLSHKRVKIIEINGKCDKDNVLNYHFKNH